MRFCVCLVFADPHRRRCWSKCKQSISNLDVLFFISPLNWHFLVFCFISQRRAFDRAVYGVAGSPQQYQPLPQLPATYMKQKFFTIIHQDPYLMLLFDIYFLDRWWMDAVTDINRVIRSNSINSHNVRGNYNSSNSHNVHGKISHYRCSSPNGLGNYHNHNSNHSCQFYINSNSRNTVLKSINRGWSNPLACHIYPIWTIQLSVSISTLYPRSIGYFSSYYSMLELLLPFS